MGLSWHIWRKDPKTGSQTWIGQFYDDKAALGWKKKQDNPDEYRITNVGPSAIAKGQGVEQPKKMTERERLAEKRKRDREVQRKQPTPAPKPKPVPETPEQKRMKEDAEALLKKHKQDEAEDLQKGINR